MSIRLREKPESRDLHYGAQGGGQTLRFTAIASAGETESQVWIAALQATGPYFNGFVRQDIKVRRAGGANVFDVDVEYGTTGVGGGGEPLGGTGNDGGPPTDPTAPAATSTPLTSGYSFSIRAPKLHLLYARNTISSHLRGGGVAPDFKNAIGVDQKGEEIEGVDWPPEPSVTLKRTVARATVTQGYLSTLLNLVGRYNNAEFYKWAAGEVLYLAAEGQYTQGEGWSITHEFGIQENEAGIEICDGLPTLPDVINKKGWEYLWVLMVKADDGGRVVKRPEAAYVVELARPAPFGLIGIGA